LQKEEAIVELNEQILRMTLESQALEDRFSSFQMKSDGVMNLSKSKINLIADISSHHQFIHLQNSQNELLDKNNNMKK
jgi:hypothetical protein